MNPIQRATEVSDVEMNARENSTSSSKEPKECKLTLEDLRGSWHLLNLMGIFNSSSHSNHKWVSLFLDFAQWVACIAMILNGIVVGYQNERVVYDKVTAILWVVQCCVQYSVLRREMLDGALPLRTIIDAGSSHDLERVGCAKNEDVKRLSSTTAYACVWLAIINIVMAGSAYFSSFFYRVLPLTNHMAWNLTGILLWLVYSYSWFTPLLFVVVPAHLFTQRVQAMANYIAESRTQADFDIERAMEWYDELYDLNRQLQRSVSPMATVALAIGVPLQILVMLVINSHIAQSCNQL
jgi:hypothetical protein